MTLKLQPTATYGGTLLDEAGQAIADHEIFLAPEGNFASAIVSQQPDAAGKFHWDAVPAQTALTLRVRGDLYSPRYYISSAGSDNLNRVRCARTTSPEFARPTIRGRRPGPKCHWPKR